MSREVDLEGRMFNHPGADHDAPAGGGGPGNFRAHRSPQVKGVQRREVLVSASEVDRVLAAAWRGLPLLPAAIRMQVAAMLTPKTVGILIGVAAAGCAAQLVPVLDAVVDVTVMGLGVFAFGGDALRIASDFRIFVTVALNAKGDSDLGQAAEAFARAVTTTGIDFLMLTGVRSARMRNAARADFAYVEIEAIARSLKFKVGPNKGAIWSGIGDWRPFGKTYSGADIATAYAKQVGRKTINSALQDALQQALPDEIIPAFMKSVEALDWDTQGRNIWKILSERYAAELQGDVVAYIDSDVLYQKLGNPADRKELQATGTTDLLRMAEDHTKRTYEPLLASELDVMTDTILGEYPKVTRVRFYDIRGKRFLDTEMLRMQPTSKGSKVNH